MALEGRPGAAGKRGGGDAPSAAAIVEEASPTPSASCHEHTNSHVNNRRPSLPDRNPTSSSRVSSTNWATSNGEPGRIPRNILPSAVFGEGKDEVPMPLDGDIFSADNRDETYAFADAIHVDDAVSADTTCRGNPITSTCSTVDTSCGGSDTWNVGTNVSETARKNVDTDTAYLYNNLEPANRTEHVSASTKKRKADSVDEILSVPDFLQQSQNPSATFNAYVPSEEACEPNDKDILLGRGGLSNHHIGNIRYRHYIEDFKPYYQRLDTKDEKKEFSQTFCNFVHSYGGRFLEQDPESDGWVEAQSNKARKKCGQALREEKKLRISR